MYEYEGELAMLFYCFLFYLLDLILLHRSNMPCSANPYIWTIKCIDVPLLKQTGLVVVTEEKRNEWMFSMTCAGVRFDSCERKNPGTDQIWVSARFPWLGHHWRFDDRRRNWRLQAHRRVHFWSLTATMMIRVRIQQAWPAAVRRLAHRPNDDLVIRGKKKVWERWPVVSCHFCANRKRVWWI